MFQEDTRLSNPPCTLRGTGWNRWEWLCQDPQEELRPFDFNISNRIAAKDAHRPCIPIPISFNNRTNPNNKNKFQKLDDCNVNAVPTKEGIKLEKL